MEVGGLEGSTEGMRGGCGWGPERRQDLRLGRPPRTAPSDSWAIEVSRVLIVPLPSRKREQLNVSRIGSGLGIHEFFFSLSLSLSPRADILCGFLSRN